MKQVRRPVVRSWLTEPKVFSFRTQGSHLLWNLIEGLFINFLSSKFLLQRKRLHLEREGEELGGGSSWNACLWTQQQLGDPYNSEKTKLTNHLICKVQRQELWTITPSESSSSPSRNKCRCYLYCHFHHIIDKYTPLSMNLEDELSKLCIFSFWNCQTCAGHLCFLALSTATVMKALFKSRHSVYSQRPSRSLGGNLKTKHVTRTASVKRRALLPKKGKGRQRVQRGAS